ncbi:hypothetical protein PVAND_009871 [Polypedilum vanderplanki]|uniref:Transporter n=1 Tax=Polypedilum vanderplanki TaxID=319348 RepID=A0A9J6CE43_POLVA|nr:hypothetical protein PVAND_009871 [Polypedilum vanderplanki]
MDVKSFDVPNISGIEKSSNNGSNVEISTSSTVNLIEDRTNWSRPIEFILSCLSYAIGLGNIWRFPHLAYRNGGGAFLLPYFLAAVFIGLPIFFAELITGQYSGLGPIKAYSYLAPLFKGLGYCTFMVISFVSIYYQLIIAWVLFYLYSSFFPSLRWGTCDNDWNSENCFSTIEDLYCRQENVGSASDQIFYRGGCREINEICSIHDLVGVNASNCMNTTTNELVPINDVITRSLSSEEFFYEHVLGIGDARWDNFGYPRWQMVIFLFLGWTLTYLCLIKGVQSMGKVVYFTATFPYVILTALLIRSLTLEGSYEGIMFYITPQWERLLSPGVWGDASSQIFYSFGLACGSLVALASYNKFKNNCHFDAVFISIINFGTAIFGGFVVFATLGFLSNSMQQPIDNVVTGGPGLTFITYPEAILLMPLPNLWAILFFLMMLILGLGSQFPGVQMISTSIVDHWPHLRNKEWKVTAGVCMSCFVLGLPMTCHGGIYLFTLMEWHTASWAILLIGAAEIVIFSWVYGINNTLDMIKEMGMKFVKVTRYFWKAVWVVITPIGSVAIFIFILTDLGPSEFRDYVFPLWADILGWMFGLATLVPFIVFAIYQLIVVKDKKTLLKPTDLWGPQEIDGQRIDRAVLA